MFIVFIGGVTMTISNLNLDFGDYVAFLSFLIAVFALFYSQKNAKINSYSQKASNRVLLIKSKDKHGGFSVKLFNSVMSDVVPFDYNLVVYSKIGGISSCNVFPEIEDSMPLGISKDISNVKRFNPILLPFWKYAFNQKLKFEASPFFPYCTLNGEFLNNDTVKYILNRYHFYIEITDYCHSTEIWYVSFSLLATNVKFGELNWKKYDGNYDFKYFAFDEICVVSPKDLIRNINRLEKYNKNLSQIDNRDSNTGISLNLINNGLEKTQCDLELYEMKIYNEFLNKLNKNNLLN